MNIGFTSFNNSIYDYDLKPIERDILLYLKKYMFNDKNTCNVSIGRMSRELRICYKTAWFHLHELAKKSIISIISGAKQGITNIYTILIDIFVGKNKKNKKENKMTSQNGNSYYDNFREKANRAIYGGNSTTRQYDINILEQQLLKASIKQK